MTSTIVEKRVQAKFVIYQVIKHQTLIKGNPKVQNQVVPDY